MHACLVAGLSTTNDVLSPEQIFDGSFPDMEWSIDFATIHDADEIAYVHHKTWTKTYGSGLDIKHLEERQALWHELLENPSSSHQVLILKIKSRVIGFCGYIKDNEDIQIKGLYVHPAFQGIGAGRTLMTHLKSLFRHGTYFYLWVYEKNLTAIKFYKRNGFKMSDCKPDKYPGTNKNIFKYELRVPTVSG